ncbi:MAG TPA: GxxExxY protein [Gammaproteobacteria bacterium]
MEERKKLSEQVIACAYVVSNRLGVGFLESVYENALCVELEKRGIQYQQQKPLKVFYEGVVVGNFVTDVIVEDKLLVELKVVTTLLANHKAQLMNYLKATEIPVGLLLNFGTPKVGVQRIVNQYIESELI